MVAEYGDRQENLGDRGFRYGDRHDVRYNDQERSTLNFQWGDRKGAWWAGYRDRHENLGDRGAQIWGQARI